MDFSSQFNYLASQVYPEDHGSLYEAYQGATAKTARLSRVRSIAGYRRPTAISKKAIPESGSKRNLCPGK